MDRIILTCGKWRFEEDQWIWRVNSRLGCKIIEVSDDVTFDTFERMVHEDFGVDQEIFKVKLSYVSDALMHGLPHDTPPIFVTNERQLRCYVQQFRKEAIRLCVEFGRISLVGLVEGNKDLKCGTYIEPSPNMVSRKSSMYGMLFNSDEEVCEETVEDAVSDNRFDYCDDADGASSGDEDFYGVGRTVKEDPIYPQVPMKKDLMVCNDWYDEYLDIEKRSLQLAVGQKYPSKTDLLTRLKVCSVVYGFDFDVVSSTKTLLVVNCWVKNCGWKLRASCLDPANPCFYIRRYVGKHNCSVTERGTRSRQATPDILGRLYVTYVGGVGPAVIATHVIEGMNKRFGMQLTYWKAHRTLKAARALLKGTPEDSYAELPSYLYMIRRANPGTHVKLELDGRDRFKYLFISFAASIRGFPYMRKVVVVDGTFLQGKYKGTLLTATMQDGNFQIFPIAFAVVDIEDDDSWEWFFRQLSLVIPDFEDLAIISDRHRAIRNAIEQVYPLAARGVCTYHLRKNITSRFRGEGFKLFKKVAAAYRLEEFDVIFGQIKSIDPRLHAYLVDAGVSVWSRVHFPGNRYNFMTSNIAESINNAISSVRSFPIVALIDAIRAMLTRWFAERRAKALATTTTLTPAIEKLLQFGLLPMQKRLLESRRYKVQNIANDGAIVTGAASSHLVKLGEKTCTCRRFDFDKIPCVHALAAADASQHSSIEMTDPYYYTSYWYHAYGQCVMPKDTACPVPEDFASTICQPPVVRIPPGRPKVKRLRGWCERPKTAKRPRKKTFCSRCKSPGHNVRTCRAESQC